MFRVAASMFLALALAPASSPRAEEAEHPLYASWAKSPAGTVVVVREVTEGREAGGPRLVVTKRRVLRSIDDRRAVVEETVETETPEGTSRTGPRESVIRRTFPLPPGVDRSRLGRPQQFETRGEERVEAAGRTFRAEWFDTKGQTEAGPSRIRAWYADDVPGLLVKSVTRVPDAGKTTTATVVAIEAP